MMGSAQQGWQPWPLLHQQPHSAQHIQADVSMARMDQLSRRRFHRVGGMLSLTLHKGQRIFCKTCPLYTT